VLRIVDNELPQRRPEGLETVVALVAVAMVTYMMVWMTEHARDLKGQLQNQAAEALAQGSALALVAMAFLAVLREGFETAVFLLAAFNDATDPVPPGLGVVLGLVVAVALGVGIYRGGLRLNLSRFFRATGAVLVLVAAGLVASSLHTAAEAGWVVGGQAQALDLSAVIRPGTISEALITPASWGSIPSRP
jgi:high-affinity iron transporter